MNIDFEKKEDSVKKETQIAGRKIYIKPVLEALGDLRTLTLGGSTAGPDFSGNDMFGEPLGG